MHYTCQLDIQHNTTPPTQFYAHFLASIRVSVSLSVLFSASFERHRVPIPVHHVALAVTARILTTKQTSVTQLNSAHSKDFCKYLQPPWSRNRAFSQRIVVFRDRVPARAARCCHTCHLCTPTNCNIGIFSCTVIYLTSAPSLTSSSVYLFAQSRSPSPANKLYRQDNMPKTEKVTRGKGKKADTGKKKKGMHCFRGRVQVDLTSYRPQRPQAWSFRVHVLRQRAA